MSFPKDGFAPGAANEPSFAPEEAPNALLPPSALPNPLDPEESTANGDEIEPPPKLSFGASVGFLGEAKEVMGVPAAAPKGLALPPPNEANPEPLAASLPNPDDAKAFDDVCAWLALVFVSVLLGFFSSSVDYPWALVSDQ